MTINELQRKWDSISPNTGGFLLVSGDHPLSFHIGYYGEQMCFMVLDTGKVEKTASSKAINSSCVEMDNGKYALRFLLNYPSLNELFVKLCWDLIDCSQNNLDPIATILSRFNSWMRLLQKRGEGLLSPSAQKGLIGELLFLKELIVSEGSIKALNSWVGPEGSDQDFICENSWNEIKATTIASTTVVISSLQQLDRNDNGHLVVYFMDKTASNGVQTLSLPEVVDDVKKLLPIGATDLFLCKLAMCGYYLKDRERYNEMRYRLSEKRVYSVEEGFPKLTRGNVPSEVHNAKYELDLLTIDRFRI